MKFLRLNFDPWDTPIKKRIQIILVGLLYFGVIYAGPVLMLICFCLLFTPLYWLTLLLFCWTYFDRHTCEKGSRPIEWFQNLIIWDYIHEYLPKTLKLPSEFTLNPTKNYLFACFPHGVVPGGCLGSLCHKNTEFRKLYPNFRINIAVLPILFIYPLIRELAMAWGGISSSFQSLNYVLSQLNGGNIILLFPGGVKEAALNQHHPELYQFFVKNRKGFVKIAIKTGADIVPVITFGESNLLSVEGNVWRKFRWLTKRIPLLACALPHGRGLLQSNFGFIPKDKPIMTVVGNLINVSKTEDPSEQLIDEIHTKFIQELIQLFEKYKAEYFEHPQEKFLEIF